MNKFALALSAATAVLAYAATPALAQDDAPVYSTGDAPTYFDGVYVGGSFGRTLQPNRIQDRVVFDTNRDGNYGDTVNTAAGVNAFGPGFCRGRSYGSTPGAGCSRNKGDDWEYSGRIGFDRRVGDHLVGGALVEVSRSESHDQVTAFSTTPASYTLGRELDVAVAVRGRVGYSPGRGGALFYLTGGPAIAKVNHTFSTSNTANAFREVRDGKWVYGGQVGGGAEVMLGDHLGLGLEYLYNSYVDKYYRVEVTQGTAAANNPFLLNGGGTNLRPSNRNYDFHSIRATVSYHF